MTTRPALGILLGALLLSTGCGVVDGGEPTTGRPTAATGGTVGPVAPTGRAGDGRALLRIVTQLGEQCPHEPVTPDPRCDPKPRPDTGFEVRSAAGDVVTRGRSGADGRATVAVGPGTYDVRGETVAGWRIAPQRRVTVDGNGTVEVPLTWTNGIQ
ncbi:hypothetical protein [Micromonospora sp. NPDC049799]|uniref:hypothetical protein n=1 Tax=Micromonospora sp. NPDC049799 TaxID=3154741 RepID=UPI00340250B8